MSKADPKETKVISPNFFSGASCCHFDTGLGLSAGMCASAVISGLHNKKKASGLDLAVEITRTPSMMISSPGSRYRIMYLGDRLPTVPALSRSVLEIHQNVDLNFS